MFSSEIMALQLKTAGESHGPGITCMLEGLPSGLHLPLDYLNAELARRQKGYGRGTRMQIERDTVEVLAGLRGEVTLGTPLVCFIRNRDFENWRDVMGAEATAEGQRSQAFTIPRPGHGDLAGALKHHFKDMRNVLERTSARETTARVAAGAACKRLLEEFDISLGSAVSQIGPIECDFEPTLENCRRAEASEVRCPDQSATEKMKKALDEAKAAGDTLGGKFYVIAQGVPPGLGSYAQWDEKLDGQLAQALMSIQGIKAVEIGAGTALAGLPGSQVHDEIFLEANESGVRLGRKSNRAGGLEAGLTNGEPLVITCTMKPIPTLRKPLQSVDLRTRKPQPALAERSDVCAVPAAAVVGEAMLAFVLAKAFLAKFAGDTLDEIRQSYTAYKASLAALDWFE